MFSPQIFFDPKKFPTQIIFDPKSLGRKFFLTANFFWPKKNVRPISFLTQKMSEPNHFWTNKFPTQKIFSPKKCRTQKNFRPHFLGLRKNVDPIFFYPKKLPTQFWPKNSQSKFFLTQICFAKYLFHQTFRKWSTNIY